MPESTSAHIAEIYKTESRRVLATLIRLLGDIDRAEEALQEAFAAALSAWPAEGIPEEPRAWLVSTGKFKGIKGSSEFLVRSPLRALAIDMASGAALRVASGLAVLPKLTYELPSK